MCTRKEMGTNLEERNEDDELRSKENRTAAQRKPRKDTRKDSGKEKQKKKEAMLKKGEWRKLRKKEGNRINEEKGERGK